jgi:recombination protein RecR
MADYPPSVRRLISVLRELPSVGPRSAERLAVHLLQGDGTLPQALGQALEEIREKIKRCEVCGFFAEGDTCEVCRDPKRERCTICVVEDAADVIAVEKSEAYRGVYHVLGGTLSPLDEVGPDDLAIESLMTRLREAEPAVQEVVIALGSDVKGETTSLYLAKLLGEFPVRVSRPATGISVGGDLEYADSQTLSHAFSRRRPIDEAGDASP